MSYISKRTLASMGVGLIAITVYIIYALGAASPQPENLGAWAVAMLVFIGACIVLGIIIQIPFNIAYAVGTAAKEKNCEDKRIERIIKSSMLEDERYKLIEAKSSRASYACAGLGVVAGLIVLAVGVPTIIALHIMAGAFVVGSILEGCMTIYLNERGVQSG